MRGNSEAGSKEPVISAGDTVVHRISSADHLSSYCTVGTVPYRIVIRSYIDFKC